MIKKIILLGAPGVGKGLLSKQISECFGIPHISTGNIFRNEINNKTSLGLKVIDITSKGGYVTDDITNKIIENVLKSNKNKETGFLLDGYPRTKNQAMFLKGITDIDVVILLEAPTDIIIERLSGRRLCSKCKKSYHIKFNKPKKENICDDDGEELIMRSDDKLESIKHRLKVYEEQTLLLVDFYEKEGLLKRYDTYRDYKLIFKDVKEDIF